MQSKNNLMILLLGGLVLLSTAAIADTGFEVSNQNVHMNVGGDIKFTGSPITATSASLPNNYTGINLSGLQTSHLSDNKIDKVTTSKVNPFVKH